MPPERRSERRTRRRVFRLWVGLTVVFALLLALALPFLRGEPFAYLAGVPSGRPRSGTAGAGAGLARLVRLAAPPSRRAATAVGPPKGLTREAEAEG
jgi:hypothetical protein